LCGGSDPAAINDDGSAKCFSCGGFIPNYEAAMGGTVTEIATYQRNKMDDSTSYGEFYALTDRGIRPRSTVFDPSRIKSVTSMNIVILTIFIMKLQATKSARPRTRVSCGRVRLVELASSVNKHFNKAGSTSQL
jgi:hypothetical protein